MIKTIYKLAFLLSFCFFATTLFAASEAEYKKLSREYVLNADGSQEYRCYKELTLFTHTAMNSTYGETFIVYDPTFQEVKIHASYTRQKDGTVIETPENAFVEVLPRAAANSPAYNHLKELVIVHTGLELGANIFLDYSVITKPGYSPELDVFEEVWETSPIKEYNISVSLPASKPLYYKIHGLNAKENLVEASGTKKISWTISNVPASSREPLVDVGNGDVPFFAATTWKSNKEALNSFSKNFDQDVNPKIKSWANKLVEECKNDTEKLYALLKYVTTDIDNSRLSMQQTGFRMRPAIEVVKTAYGTELEKINLLHHLLTAVNLSCQSVVMYAVEDNSSNLGLASIAKLFIIAKADGKEYYLNALNNKMSEAVVKADVLPVFALNGEKINISSIPAELDYNYTISLSSEKADIKTVAIVGNSFIPYNDTYLSQFTANDKQAKEEKKSNKSVFEYSYSQPVKVKESYITYTLPDCSQSLYYSPYRQFNTERKQALVLPYMANEKFKYSFTLPEDIILSTPEKQSVIDNSVGKIEVSIKKTGKTVNVERNLNLKTKYITPDKYKEFHALMAEWTHPHSKTLLFKQIK